jgi:hypothetical protein
LRGRDYTQKSPNTKRPELRLGAQQ